MWKIVLLMRLAVVDSDFGLYTGAADGFVGAGWVGVAMVVISNHRCSGPRTWRS